MPVWPLPALFFPDTNPAFQKIHCPKDLKKWITSNHPSFYPKTEDEKMAVNVRFEDDTVWLTQEQLSLLFSKAKSTINEHIQNIFNEGELTESMCTLIFGNSEYQQKRHIIKITTNLLSACRIDNKK